jgi:hypothetical protein
MDEIVKVGVSPASILGVRAVIATARKGIGGLDLPANDRFNQPSGVFFNPGVPISI